MIGNRCNAGVCETFKAVCHQKEIETSCCVWMCQCSGALLESRRITLFFNKNKLNKNIFFN